MAQEVDYFEDGVTFTEGPFVICNPLGNGWRIEAEIKGSPCPGLPDASIYDLLEIEGIDRGKYRYREVAEKICNQLNTWVREGRVILDPKGGKVWIAVR
jgi:hypothetical protein